MEAINKVVNTVKSNPVGVIAGALAGYFGAKKLGKVENKYAVIAITIGGAIAGAIVQSKIKARKSVPTAATVKVVQK